MAGESDGLSLRGRSTYRAPSAPDQLDLRTRRPLTVAVQRDQPMRPAKPVRLQPKGRTA